MWLRALAGTLTQLLPSLKDVIEVVAGNRKDRERNDSDEQIEVHREQASGYTYKVKNRTAWDSAVDGLNRLPRPIITFMVIALFVWACVDPQRFSVSMRALDTVPQMLWTIVAMILGFWFGSRMLAKDLSSQASQRSIDNAREYFERKESPSSSPSSRAPREAAPDDSGNSVVDQWRGFNQR